MVNKKYMISFILITIFIFSTISIVSAQNTNDLSHNPVNLSDESVSILKINNSNNVLNNTNNENEVYFTFLSNDI